MPCVVVKSQSVMGGQTTDGGVHYLTKECADTHPSKHINRHQASINHVLYAQASHQDVLSYFSLERLTISLSILRSSGVLSPAPYFSHAYLRFSWSSASSSYDAFSSQISNALLNKFAKKPQYSPLTIILPSIHSHHLQQKQYLFLEHQLLQIQWGLILQAMY